MNKLKWENGHFSQIEKCIDSSLRKICRCLTNLWKAVLCSFAVLVRVSVAVMKLHDLMQLWEQRFYFGLYFHIAVRH